MVSCFFFSEKGGPAIVFSCFFSQEGGPAIVVLLFFLSGRRSHNCFFLVVVSQCLFSLRKEVPQWLFLVFFLSGRRSRNCFFRKKNRRDGFLGGPG